MLRMAANEERQHDPQKGRNILNTVRQDIIEKTKTSEPMFWQKNWPDGQVPPPLPYNGTSNNPYSGINILLLEKDGCKTDPRYYTFKQVQGIKDAHVKKGERSKQIVFFKVKSEKEATKDSKTSKASIDVYHVFNAQQIEGLEPYAAPENPEKNGHKRIVSLIEQLSKKDGFDTKLYDAYTPSQKEKTDKETGFMDGFTMLALLYHAMGKLTNNISKETETLKTETSLHLAAEALQTQEMNDETKETVRMGMSLYLASRAFSVPFKLEELSCNEDIKYTNTVWGEILKKEPKELTQAARDATKALNYLLNKEREYNRGVETETTQETSKGEKEPPSNTFVSELSRIRQEAGSSVEIKDAEANKYYGPGQLKVYEKTAVLTISNTQKIAFDAKDLKEQYPAGADIKVRGMKLLAEDKGVYITPAQNKENNER